MSEGIKNNNEFISNANNNASNDVNNGLNNNANNNVNTVSNVNNGEFNNANRDEDILNDINQDHRSLQLDNNEKDENPNAIASNDNPESDHQEETAAEFAPTRGFLGERPFLNDTDTAEQETADGQAAEGRGVGAFAIILSIISLFFLPVILGAAGIIVGFIARRNNATGLGNSAIGIGAISIILTLFFAPFF